MRSFELLDTILFRVCGSSDILLKRMQTQWKELPVDFYDQRKSTQGKTLFDIYQKLSLFFQWSSVQRDRFMEQELMMEEHYLYPIQSIVQRLTKEDIIVVSSDTYLEVSFLKRVLRKWKIENELFVGPQIWKTLVEKGYSDRIQEHYGTDVEFFRVLGIKTIQITESDYTDMEKRHEKELADCLRFVRLTTPFQYPFYQWVLKCQLDMNLPHLFQFCQTIREYIKTHGISKVLFSLRDCYYLFQLFNQMYPGLDTELLWCSRNIYSNVQNTHYLSYFRSKCGDPPSTLIVDLGGTGQSLKRFLAHHNIKNVHIFYYILYTNHNQSEYIHHVYITNNNDMLEMLNYINLGTLIHFDEKGPVLATLEYPPYYPDIIEQIVHRFLESLQRFPIHSKIKSRATLDIFHSEKNRKHYHRLNRIHTNKHQQNHKYFLRMYHYALFHNHRVPVLDIYCLHQPHQIHRKQSMISIVNELKLISHTNIHWINPVQVSEGTRRVNKNELSHLQSFLSILEHHPNEHALLFLEDDLKPLYPMPLIRQVIESFHKQLSYQNELMQVDILKWETCYTNRKTHEVYHRLRSGYCSGSLYIPMHRAKSIASHLRTCMENEIYATDHLLSILNQKNRVKMYIHLPMLIQDSKTFGTSIQDQQKSLNRDHGIRSIWQSFLDPSSEVDVKNERRMFLWIILLGVACFVGFFLWWITTKRVVCP